MTNTMDDMKGMVQQLQDLQAKVKAAQEELANETVTGSAAGGKVKVILTGDQKCRGVEIAPELLKGGDAVKLQEWLMKSMNDALEASRQLAVKRLGPLAGMGGK